MEQVRGDEARAGARTWQHRACQHHHVVSSLVLVLTVMVSHGAWWALEGEG
jgi:hypothetical protein